MAVTYVTKLVQICSWHEDESFNRNTQAGDTLIYINRDLTIKERETEKALRDELKEKRKGNGRWVIRNKKVVEVLEEGAAAAPRDT